MLICINVVAEFEERIKKLDDVIKSIYTTHSRLHSVLFTVQNEITILSLDLEKLIRTPPKTELEDRTRSRYGEELKDFLEYRKRLTKLMERRKKLLPLVSYYRNRMDTETRHLPHQWPAIIKPTDRVLNSCYEYLSQVEALRDIVSQVRALRDTRSARTGFPEVHPRFQAREGHYTGRICNSRMFERVDDPAEKHERASTEGYLLRYLFQ